MFHTVKSAWICSLFLLNKVFHGYVDQNVIIQMSRTWIRSVSRLLAVFTLHVN